MDSRVIELPTFFRALLVKGIIINVRSHKSAATYREIWTDEGSPLLVNSARLTEKTAAILGEEFVVELAMRYGNPSVSDKLRALHRAGVRHLIVIPLYPQYSGSTNGSTFDAVANALKKHRWVPSLDFVSHYYHKPDYTKAVAQSIQEHWNAHGRNQKLIMSFHGVPKKYITQGDPYQSQCEQTAQNIAETLNLNKDEWMLVFQSRFGAQEWLQPYCDKTLQSLPDQGVKSVDIVCPGFSVDCLETLEEIEIENRDYFLNAGGENYTYIPCLNDTDSHARLFATLVRDRAKH